MRNASRGVFSRWQLFEAAQLGAKSALSFHQILADKCQVAMKPCTQLFAGRANLRNDRVLKSFGRFRGLRGCR